MIMCFGIQYIKAKLIDKEHAMRMHRREDRGKMQIAALSAAIIKKLLELSNCSQHYRVEILNDGLIIRESTQNPPIQRRKERFEGLVRKLEGEGIFKFADARGVGIVDGQEVNIPCKSVTQINVRKLFVFLGLGVDEKPQNVEESVWVVIPKEIKVRWNRFSPELQEYIVMCCEPHAGFNIVNLLETKLITDSKRSPITFDVPNIPVHLPNPDLKSGASNEVYDLVEVLNIKQRDPDHPERRADPITRRYFDLTEVIPAKEAREKILQQGMPSGPK